MQQTSDTNPPQADLERVFAILRSRVRLIALCFLLTAGAAFVASELQQKQYSASATLLFRNPGFAEDLFGTGASPPGATSTREAATNARLVGLDIVAERTARELKDLSSGEVSGMIGVSSEGEAELVSVTATSDDPAEAQRVANQFAREFIAFRAGADRVRLLRAKRIAERALARLSPEERPGVRGEALSRGVEKLGILASLQTGNAELVQPARIPTSPSSPKPFRNGILGAIVGLLLGIGVAFLLERLNRRIRDPEEAREALGLPVLGTVPESKAIMASNEGSAAPELPFMENESFRMLRASLRYFNIDQDVRSVLVTSHSAEVGKSTVAWNLARVAATSARVILLETDLRNPSLTRQHGLNMGPGLSELLTHQVGLEDVIQSKAISTGGGGSGSGPGETSLDVIVAGSSPPNPAELIESQTMSDVLAQLNGYDLIVLDTPPLGVVSDAFPLMRQVGGVIVVARMGRTTRDSAEQLREQLDQLDAPTLGVVANAIKTRRGGRYGYGYYGGYSERAAEQEAEAPVNQVAGAPPRT